MERACCWLEQAKRSKTLYTIIEEKKMFLILKLACVKHIMKWDVKQAAHDQCVECAVVKKWEMVELTLTIFYAAW